MDAAASEVLTQAAPAVTVRIVTATKLTLNGTCSWMFMFNSRMPREWIGRGELWGFVWVESKDADYFNPWEWAKKERGEEHGEIVGDDGTPRWAIHIFESGKGQTLSCGFDDSSDLGGWRTLVREGSLPAVSILCMERSLFDRVAPMLAEEGVTVEVHHYEGELTSS